MTEERAKQQIAEIEARISQGEIHINYVRSLISKLQRDGHERAVEKARVLLKNLLDLQRTYEMDRAALRKEPWP